MKPMKPILATLLALLFIPAVSAADQSRIERSFGVFSQGINQLLLDTEHVFVRQDDKVDHFYLPGTGVFFIGRISLTRSINLPGFISQWSKWFDSDSSDSDESESDEDTGKKSEDKHVARRKYASDNAKDQERIANMDKHIAAFKKELITTVLDYGAILKGVYAEEEIIVVFFIRDSAFKKKYGTGQMILRVRSDLVKKMSNAAPDDPRVLKAFKFNI